MASSDESADWARRIRRFLENLSKNIRPQSGAVKQQQDYHTAFRESGQKKAQEIIAELRARPYLDLSNSIYLSLGGSSGAELLLVMEELPITCGVLVEYSQSALNEARRQVEPKLGELGKSVESIRIDLSSVKQYSIVKEVVSELRRSKSLNTLIVSMQAVLHELPMRGEGGSLDYFAFFSEVLDPSFPNCLLFCREPCMPNWPGIVDLSIAELPPDLLLDAAKDVAKYCRHSDRNTTKVDEKIRIESPLAIELLTKLFYYEDYAYEKGESVSWIDPSEFMMALERVKGMRNAVRGNLLISDGFYENYQRLEVEAFNLEGRMLPPPLCFLKVIAERRGIDRRPRRSRRKNPSGKLNDANLENDTTLIGRDGEVKALLEKASTQNITLHGPPGIGKTHLGQRLSQLVSARLRTESPLFFHSFYNEPSVESVFRRFVDFAKINAIKADITGFRGTVVLDGAETLIGDYSDLLESLQLARVIVTTINRAQGTGFSHEVLPLKEDAGLKCFLHYAKLPAVEPIHESIVGLLAGHPLAIRLAACYIKNGNSAERCLSRLHAAPFDILILPDSDRERRKTSVRRCFELSFERLTNVAAGILCDLSLLSLAPVVTSDLLSFFGCEARELENGIDELVRLSLLIYEDGGNATRIVHPLVHMFAREKIEDLKVKIKKIVPVVVQKFQLESRAVWKGKTNEYLFGSWFHPHLTSLLDQCEKFALYSQVVSLGCAAASFLDRLSYYEHGRYVLERAEAAARLRGEYKELREILPQLGLAYENLGMFDEQVRVNEEAVRLFSGLSFSYSKGWAIGHLGEAYVSVGRYENALTQHKTVIGALEEEPQWACRELQEDKFWEWASLLMNQYDCLGVAFRRLGRLDEAESCYRRSMALADEIGQVDYRVNSRNNLSTLELLRGRPQVALPIAEEAWALCSDRHTRDSLRALRNFGKAKALAGFREEGIDLLRASRDIARNLKEESILKGILDDLSEVGDSEL